MSSVKWPLILAISTCLFNSSLHAQRNQTDNPQAKAILSMDRAWADASCKVQPDLLNIFAPEFIGTKTNGSHYDRQQAINIDAKNLHWGCQYNEASVRFINDTLAISYSEKSSMRKGTVGARWRLCIGSTKTWIKRQNKWTVVAAQDTLVTCP